LAPLPAAFPMPISVPIRSRSVGLTMSFSLVRMLRSCSQLPHL
jgi:hypothetical protein